MPVIICTDFTGQISC